MTSRQLFRKYKSFEQNMDLLDYNAIKKINNKYSFILDPPREVVQ